jgi:hypothetical protein
MNQVPTPSKNPRAKYITLAVLVAWVVGVFLFTIFKISGGK